MSTHSAYLVIVIVWTSRYDTKISVTVLSLQLLQLGNNLG